MPDSSNSHRRVKIARIRWYAAVGLLVVYTAFSLASGKWTAIGAAILFWLELPPLPTTSK
jgi:VanZ family protein